MLHIHGIGHAHPANVITNAFLESLDIGADGTWIDERTGIMERRTALDLDYIRRTHNVDPRAAKEACTVTGIDVATEAVNLALQRSGLDSKDIGLVVAGGCTPELSIPAESSRLSAALGIQSLAFDVGSACSSFAAQMFILDSWKPERVPDFVVLVSIEMFTRAVNYSDRRVAALFGDGASAVVISTKHPSNHQVTNIVYGTDSAGWNLIMNPSGGHFVQDGRAVQHFAIRKTLEIRNELSRQSATVDSNSHLFIGHQANRRMLESICRLGDIPSLDHRTNVDQFGNCGAAGAPSVMSECWDELAGKVTDLIVVGAGLSWGGIRVASLCGKK